MRSRRPGWLFWMAPFALCLICVAPAVAGLVGAVAGTTVLLVAGHAIAASVLLGAALALAWTAWRRSRSHRTRC